mgnify:CR=1 FL=1
MSAYRTTPPWLTGVLTVALMSACITFWFVVMLPFIGLRCIPVHKLQRWASDRCVAIATLWVGSNHRIYDAMHGQQGQVRIEGQFKPGSSYLVVCNHSAWSDIVLLFDALYGHAPFGRFFLKKGLIWVPIVGVVCWAMDFPFMKRHSRQAIAKNPALASQDLETTRKACEKYKASPVTVINFLEGTRFTPAKHARSKSPYTHLLAPKYGGLSATLDVVRRSDAARAALQRHTRRLRGTLASLGYPIAQGSEQIIALEAGTEMATLALRDELEARGVFGAVFISPATSRNRALVRLTLNAGLTESELARVEAVAAEIGSAARWHHHDVTREADWAAAVALAQREFGGLDLLVSAVLILDGDARIVLRLRRRPMRLSELR